MLEFSFMNHPTNVVHFIMITWAFSSDVQKGDGTLCSKSQKVSEIIAQKICLAKNE